MADVGTHGEVHPSHFWSAAIGQVQRHLPSLKHQINFTIGALICAAIGFAAVQCLTFLRAELRDTIKAENSAFLRSLSDDLDFAVGEDRRDLFDLGRTIPPAMLHAPHAAYTYLTSQVGMLRIFDGGISLYSVTGAVVTDTRAGNHHSPAERAALQAVLASSDSQISEPFNVADDDPRIALFVPIQSGNHLAGVLEGVWRLKGDNAIVSIPHMYVGKAGYIFIADSQGRVISHPDPHRIMSNLTEPSDALPLEDLPPGHTMTAESYIVHGQPMLTTIYRPRTTGWLVGINLPQAEAFASVTAAQRYVVFGALALLAIILIVMSQTMRHLMTPLEAITEQIRAISRSGHPDGRRIRLTAPPRELAELADGFNEMLESLERHRDQIARREARFRALIEDCPDTLAVMDRDGKLTFINPSRFTEGASQVELLQASAMELLHPDDRARGRAAVGEVLSHPERTTWFAGRVCEPDGTYRHYESILHNRLDDPNIGGIVLSIRDITERRAAEAAVRVEEQRLRVALECANLVVFNQDRDLRYTWNFKSHLFDDPDFMIGKTDEELFPPDLAARLTAFKRGVLERGLGDRISVTVDDGGNDRFYLLAAQPLRDADDNIIGLIGAAMETTEQHRTEAFLRHAQRLESLGMLTGGIAHDFNNYLGIISANLECILPTLGEGSHVHRYGENALTAVRQGVDLTRNLLAFARQQPLRPTRLDLNTLLKNFNSILRNVTGPAIELTCDLDPDLWPCEADAGELQNALVNLAINACDAMPEGGTMTIRTRNRHMAGSEDGQNGDSVQLSVSDTGHGMPPEVLEHAFDPFFTTKPARDGTGLGLSMVYGFARQSGGHVVIDSVVGCGTTVEIHLPRRLSGEA